MAIRNKNLQWTEDAMTLNTLVCQALRPIYESNKDKFEPEEIHYIVTNAIGGIITQDMVEQKAKNFIETMKNKQNK